MKNSDYSRAVFKHVLVWLKNKNMQTSKIAIQKTLFYLQEKGVPLHLDFEPYSYGPFSKQIMETASDMERAGEIIVGRTSYTPDANFSETLPQEVCREIDAHLEHFSEQLGHNFSFDSLELYGTVLYCIQALQENGMDTDRSSVIREVRAWKGRKYTEEDIGTAYDSLAPDFVNLPPGQ